MSAMYFLYGATLSFPVWIILRQAKQSVSPPCFSSFCGDMEQVSSTDYVLNLTEAYDRDLTGHHLSHKYFFLKSSPKSSLKLAFGFNTDWEPYVESMSLNSVPEFEPLASK